MYYFVSIHLDGAERAGCFGLFLFLVSRDYGVALPQVCLQFVIVVFPDHTHYFVYDSDDIGSYIKFTKI